MDLTDFTIKAIWESGVMEKAMESALDIRHFTLLGV
jgi:hypothetical protein